MNRQTVIKRCMVALGLAVLFMAVAVPAYAIADGIQRASTDRPDHVQLSQPRLLLAPQPADVPNSVLRPQTVHLESAPAAGPVPEEVPSSVRKEPGRLGP